MLITCLSSHVPLYVFCILFNKLLYLICHLFLTFGITSNQLILLVFFCLSIYQHLIFLTAAIDKR
ncbi:hypothetical protein K502DRAFT_239578 [Neoconidiobolus thromboides FSU 785]|nr:hypothetical protein K502DRAFT_239578 [Neoconidiobolus thromboides FSU 785]